MQKSKMTINTKHNRDGMREGKEWKRNHIPKLQEFMLLLRRAKGYRSAKIKDESNGLSLNTSD